MLHSSTADLELKKDLEVAEEVAKTNNIRLVELGRIYKEGSESPFYRHFKESVERRIELLEKSKESLKDEQHKEWLEIRQEVRLMKRFLRLVPAVIDMAARAEGSLREQKGFRDLLKQKGK